MREERELTPLEISALEDCVTRGSTRTNDGGLIDTLLSGLCSNSALGINNGWLVKWEANPTYREDGYISRYVPTEAGRRAVSHG
jgi:hypothetical protein